MEKKKLEMEFLNALSKKFIISIDAPRENLTSEEVKTAMKAIITGNVFIASTADLAEVVEARVITTTVNKLAV